MKRIDISFSEKLFEETLALLDEAKEYTEWQAPHDLNSLSADDNLQLSDEISRMNDRLTEIMTYLLIQRARQLGQIPQKSILNKTPSLSGKKELTTDTSLTSKVPLPPKLFYLLKETRSLYLRLLRLEIDGAEKE